MTRTRSFDQLARAWLDQMPSEVPDRVIDTVLQAIETTPQVRPPLGLAVRRFPTMNRFTVLAAATLGVVIVAGGAFLLSRPTTSQVGGPSATPASPALASAGPSLGAALPNSLDGDWLGGPRSSIGLTTSGARLVVAAGSIAIVSPDNQIAVFLASDASIVRGQLRLGGTSARGGCDARDVGTYDWSLSPSGETLTVTISSDACAARAGAVAGTWSRVDCLRLSDECLGLLDPGTYGAQFFAASLPPGESLWLATYARLQFTVPDGWANDADWPGDFSLTTTADYRATTISTPDPAARIELIPDVKPESQAQPCSGVPQPGIATTPAAVIAWLRTLPKLQVGASQSISIDGHDALAVDLALPNGPAKPCATDPVLEFLVSAGWPTAGGTSGQQGFAILQGWRERLILLDPGAGNLLAIVIETEDGSRFDAFAQAAMPIVQSFRFK
jgi:hypothetical protein